MRNKGRFILTITLSTVMTFGLWHSALRRRGEQSRRRKSLKKDGAVTPMASRGLSEWPTQWAQEPMRCAAHLTNPKSKSYEISHVRSNTMPGSPFGVPLKYKYRPTASVPFSKHAFNGEQIESGEPAAQGTQMDALGHFAYLQEMWKGKGDIPVNTARYYGGYKQQDVKLSADSRC